MSTDYVKITAKAGNGGNGAISFRYFLRSDLPGQEEHQGEQDADDPGAHVDILDLAGEDLHENVGDQMIPSHKP